jgi:hypothetical protein
MLQLEFSEADKRASNPVFLGLSLHEHGYHAKNENFDWQMAV